MDGGYGDVMPPCASGSAAGIRAHDCAPAPSIDEALVRQTITIYYHRRVAEAAKAAERAQGDLLDREADLAAWLNEGTFAHPGDPVAILWAATADASQLHRAGAGPAVWERVEALGAWCTAQGIDVTALDG
jgi:hypothetical protein